MKWSELKKLTPEERREMRRMVAKTTSDHLTYIKNIKSEEEEKNSEEEDPEIDIQE